MARLFVKAGFFLHPFGDDGCALPLRSGEQSVGGGGFGNARRTVDDQHRTDIRLIEQHFGFEQFQLKPHRAQVFAQQEVCILKGQSI